jgi:putative endonuclease
LQRRRGERERLRRRRPGEGRGPMPMIEAAYVYLLTNCRYGTLYVGVTSDLIKRIWQHRQGFVDGFAKHHDLRVLVWYEQHVSMVEAITREKQIKRWHRDWKVNLIQATNPNWNDLYEQIAQ